jgi:hypothetical protein
MAGRPVRRSKVYNLLRLAGVASAAAALAIVLPIPVLAVSELPNTPTFWDVGNDSIPDPDVTFRLASRDPNNFPWITNHVSRATGAFDTWYATDYSPTINVSVTDISCAASTTCHGVFFDTGPCGTAASNWPPYVLAVTCTLYTARQDVDGYRWDDLYDADIFLWTTGTGQNGAQPANFLWTSNFPLPPAPGNFDAQGIYTHELGHTVYLKDVSDANCNHGANVLTMCGHSTETDSVYQRTLESDDLYAVNSVY